MKLRMAIFSFAMIGCLHAMENSIVESTEINEPYAYDEYALNLRKNLVQEYVGEYAGKRILDVGCREGSFVGFMLEKAEEVFGFDSSEELIKVAQKNHLKASFCVQDIGAEWNAQLIPQENDIITSMFVLQWIKDKQSVFEQMLKSLKPGGMILCTATPLGQYKADFGAFIDMLPELANEYEYYANIQKIMKENPQSLVGASGQYPVDKQTLSKALEEAGFESVVVDQKDISFWVTKPKLYSMLYRIIKGRPTTLPIVEAKKFDEFYSKYIDILLTKLEKNEEDEYRYPVEIFVVKAIKPTK